MEDMRRAAGLAMKASRREVLAAAMAMAALPAAAQPTRTAGRRLRVVTTFTIIRDIAQNVAGEAAEVVSVTRAGAEIHNYQPTPLDVVKAQSAGLVLWNGLDLELWFEKFFANVKDVPSAVVSDGIDPMPIREGGYAGRPNPHAWMSPQNTLLYVDNIRRALTEVDAANAETYRRNAEAYGAQLRALDASLRERFGKIPQERRWLVTSEGAFSYLARDFGLREAYLWPINADQQGTPQQVRRVIDLVRENRIPVVFSESTVSDKPARQVARETGARYGGVLYVDSLSDERGKVPTYLKAAADDGRDDRGGVRRMRDDVALHASDPPGISVSHVDVVYSNGVAALRDVSFELGSSTICALLGVNGSGKSTLFKTLMGFLAPSRGEVRISGLSVKAALARGLVAYVPQSEDVDWNFPVLVEDVVTMGRYGHMNFLRIASRTDRDAVTAALERVGMADLRKRQIGELSGGQKKRAFLARALAQGSRIILLDEPFTGVDATTEAAIVDLLRDLRDDGRLIFVSTHNLASVPDFCDRVVLLNRTVIGAGPLEDVFTHDNLERVFGGSRLGFRPLAPSAAGLAR